MPAAIESAMENDVEFRKGLPLNYLMQNGVALRDDDDNIDGAVADASGKIASSTALNQRKKKRNVNIKQLSLKYNLSES